MALYLVSYDLTGPTRDYVKIQQHMLTYTPRMKPLESVWIVGSDLTALELRDVILGHIDANDKLLVIEVAKSNWGTVNVDADANRVMSSQLG